MSQWRSRTSPAVRGFIKPCQPTPTPKPPSGDDWLHEIKHDGYRLVARRDAARVRLFARNGHDWTARFPSVVEAVGALKIKSCIIDGEIAVCRPDNGVTCFNSLRSGRWIKPEAVLFAFDLIEINGDDLRREPIEARKTRLKRALSHRWPAIQYNEHIQTDGISRGLPNGPGRHRVEAAPLAVSIRAIPPLAQEQKPSE
jgi:bifunctional non-homologous end joining protein LigD